MVKGQAVIKRTKPELTLCHMLRMAWDRSYLKWDAMRRAKVAPNQYRCEKCKKVFKLREVQCDHINPCVPLTGWDNMQGFVLRLFCPSDQLQVLCQDNCHQRKSNSENKKRGR
jgi:5-methylcytosine-specific restriction endonuclease McrA